MSNVSAIILAAGAGTRMKSSKSKLVHEVCFRPIVEWVYQAAAGAGAGKIVTVVGHQAQQVKACLGEEKLYALQEKQLGTGDAVKSAMPNIDDGGCVLVLSGDVPLISEETLRAAVDYHLKNRFAATIITADVQDPTGYGRVIRDENDSVKYIVEEKDASPAQKVVTEINSGLYCFDTGLLRAALGELSNDNAQGEYYLTDTIAILLKTGYRVGAFRLADDREIMGINDKVQLSLANEAMKQKIVREHMLQGVTFINPDSCYISPETEMEPDVVIYPGTLLEGTCKIGSGSVIGPNTHLTDVTVGENTKIESSVLCSSTVGSNTNVGPFAYVRPGSTIGSQVKVGDFVEVKNSVIGEGTKISHLTYVGDSDVGEKVNFGCGTVTVNYDGQEKHRTTIGDRSFIGCNTNLVAPVTVEADSYIAAGSTITDTVPADALAIARSRQVVKEGWKKNKFGSDNK